MREADCREPGGGGRGAGGRPKLRKPSHTPQPCFTAAQISALIAAAAAECPENVPVFATLAYLGLRIGELRDLQWEDILWEVGDHGTVVVQRGGSTGATKNRRVRRIPLHPQLTPHLAQLRRPANSALVFHEPASYSNPLGGVKKVSGTYAITNCLFPDEIGG